MSRPPISEIYRQRAGKFTLFLGGAAVWQLGMTLLAVFVPSLATDPGFLVGAVVACATSFALLHRLRRDIGRLADRCDTGEES